MGRNKRLTRPAPLLKNCLWLLVFVLALLRPLPALCETARDITAYYACSVSGSAHRIKYLFDDDYSTYFLVKETKSAYIQITAPVGLAIGGIYVKWHMVPSTWRVDVLRDGQWETAATSHGEYLAEYLALPEGIAACRVCPAPGKRSDLHITELRVFNSGEIPPDVQQWGPAHEKCDILVISAHPDDEYIFMGGTIPYYLANGKAVQALYLSSSAGYRKLELLDGLWSCGMKNYPILGIMRNNFTTSLEAMYERWPKEKLYRFIVRGIRQCKPDVVVTHDIRGEYGHGAHRAAADAAIWAVARAADPKQYPDSAERYGAWQVRKLYIHLYEQNPVVMDWRIPLDYYNGDTALSIAAKAFEKHRSQQATDYRVLDDGEFDNRLFGLYFSLVGEDVQKNDFLENLPSDVINTFAVESN